MQACAGIQESGVADEATWLAILGPQMQAIFPDDSESESPSSLEAQPWGSSAATPEELNVSHEKVIAVTESANSSTMDSVGAPQTVRTKWPVVRRDDGGRDVHQLHVRLRLNDNRALLVVACTVHDSQLSSAHTGCITDGWIPLQRR